MHRSAGLLLLVLPSIGPAAPLPKDARPVISTNNADKLKALHSLLYDSWKIVWGPSPGEVTLLGWNMPATVLDDRTFKPGRKLMIGKEPIHMAVASDRETIAYCENSSQLVVENLRTGKSLTIDSGTAQPSMAFSPDGKLLSAGGGAGGAKIWEAATGKVVHTLAGSGDGGLTTVFSPDGKVLAVGNRNHTTHLYDVLSGKLIHELDKAQSHELKFSPDGKLLAVGYVDGTIGLWDVATGKLLRSTESLCKEVYTLDWSPRGDVLVTAGREGKIVLWDPKDLKALKELDSPEWVIHVRFTPDGSRLWTTGGESASREGRAVTVWGLPERCGAHDRQLPSTPNLEV
jgi:WD40 repeat protein